MKNSSLFPMLTPPVLRAPRPTGEKSGICRASAHENKRPSHSTLLLDGRQPDALSANTNQSIACDESQQAISSLSTPTASAHGQLPEPSKSIPQHTPTGPHGAPPCALHPPVPDLSELERPAIPCPSPRSGHPDRVRPRRAPPEQTSPPLHRAPAITHHETTSHTQPTSRGRHAFFTSAQQRRSLPLLAPTCSTTPSLPGHTSLPALSLAPSTKPSSTQETCSHPTRTPPEFLEKPRQNFRNPQAPSRRLPSSGTPHHPSPKLLHPAIPMPLGTWRIAILWAYTYLFSRQSFTGSGSFSCSSRQNAVTEADVDVRGRVRFRAISRPFGRDICCMF